MMNGQSIGISWDFRGRDWFHLIPKADSFWTFGKWRGSVRSRGARPPRVPSVAPRDRHGEVRVATCWFFQSPREGAWRCARGRARSPRRSRKDRYSKVHNLGAFGIIPPFSPCKKFSIFGSDALERRPRGKMGGYRGISSANGPFGERSLPSALERRHQRRKVRWRCFVSREDRRLL